MKGSEVRAAFLKFFESKGHAIVPSSPLVPNNDPTLLFANSGMVQFKDCFLGADKRAYTRATTCQKSLRLSGKHNDLENVGTSERHQTFFEMLGNFSFGDYFKRDAILFAWEFVTKVLKFPREKLWVTVFEEDAEAEKLWSELTDILPGRILKCGAKDNFWQMGDTGPCGPSSEIFYFRGADDTPQSEAGFRLDDGTYIEIWNLVFMQFNRDSAGKLAPLPKPSVDTGMGLDRVSMLLQGGKGNYDNDLLRDIIRTTEKLSGHKYDGSSYEIRDLRIDQAYARDVAMRVIADHSRAIAFLIAEGVYPGADGRPYVLRRLMRRAVRHSRALGLKEPFLGKTCATVVDIFGVTYPELVEQRDVITKIVTAEEEQFSSTLEAGLAILTRALEKLKPGEAFPGSVAFQLHDTYGFPLDLTEDALKPYGRTVDQKAFEAAMDDQRSRSREERRSQKLTYTAVSLQGPKSKFLGYQTLEADGQVVQVLPGEGKQVSLVLDQTPFYAESGGQVSDTGTLGNGAVKLRVLDTQKVQDGYFVHACELVDGDLAALKAGLKLQAAVDAQRRRAIRANHSATHLVHFALRSVLGDHVKQAGSRVDDSSLRFDYSHYEAVTAEQLTQIHEIVNDEIRSNYEVVTREMGIDEAKKSGATALFGEKYGAQVRVVQIGPNSMELCGGTHAVRSGDVGICLVGSESGISAGVRRIECWCGPEALRKTLDLRHELNAVAAMLKSDAHGLAEKVERALARTKQLERELDVARGKLASAASGDLVGTARTSSKGVRVITSQVEAADIETLKSMVDGLRVKLGSGVVALGSKQGDQAVIVAGVTADLTASGLSAGNLIKEAVKASGGKGGGRADFAQAGGVDPSKLTATLERLFELVA